MQLHEDLVAQGIAGAGDVSSEKPRALCFLIYIT